MMVQTHEQERITLAFMVANDTLDALVPFQYEAFEKLVPNKQAVQSLDVVRRVLLLAIKELYLGEICFFDTCDRPICLH